MYPTYELQIHTDTGWIKVEGTESSNRPHHYDTLWDQFVKLVKQSKPYRAHLVKEFGYRIACREASATAVWVSVDEWMVT